MYDPKTIIDLIAGNVSATGNPFGLPGAVVNTWWKKARLPQTGDSILMTGLMHQFLPYIHKSTQYTARFEDTPWAQRIGLARYAPKRMAGAGLAAMASSREKRAADDIVRTVAELLVRSGVDFTYNPRLDEYSGILLYDLGDQETFVSHAHKVANRLVRNRIERIITIDPHTTYAFKVLYPRYTGRTFEVKTYFEMLNLSPTGQGQKVTLHDPCFFGRYLELSDVPKKVLEGVNVETAAFKESGPATGCCGGPAEALSPKLALTLAERRLARLPESDGPVVTMCPICMGNLSRAGARVQDLATLLANQSQGR